MEAGELRYPDSPSFPVEHSLSGDSLEHLGPLEPSHPKEAPDTSRGATTKQLIDMCVTAASHHPEYHCVTAVSRAFVPVSLQR